MPRITAQHLIDSMDREKEHVFHIPAIASTIVVVDSLTTADDCIVVSRFDAHQKLKAERIIPYHSPTWRGPTMRSLVQQVNRAVDALINGAQQ